MDIQAKLIPVNFLILEYPVIFKLESWERVECVEFC